MHFHLINDIIINIKLKKQRNASVLEYKTEILETRVKWISDKEDAKDLLALDELINKRASEGWELVKYSYMGAFTSIKMRL